MLALRVHINEEPAVIGGADDLGVLNAIVTAVGKLGPDARPSHPDKAPEIYLSLGGLTSRAADVPDEHLRWVGHRELRIGDRIIVEVLETTSANPIESGHVAQQREDDEREYCEHCKRVCFDLKNKYESDG